MLIESLAPFAWTWLGYPKLDIFLGRWAIARMIAIMCGRMWGLLLASVNFEHAFWGAWRTSSPPKDSVDLKIAILIFVARQNEESKSKPNPFCNLFWKNKLSSLGYLNWFALNQLTIVTILAFKFMAGPWQQPWTAILCGNRSHFYWHWYPGNVCVEQIWLE